MLEVDGEQEANREQRAQTGKRFEASREMIKNGIELMQVVFSSN